MIALQTTKPRSDSPPALTAAIFDVDGVLLASPHERAWREALQGFADPDHFTTTMYQAHVAGKPRLSGALAALEALGVPDAGGGRSSMPSASRSGWKNLSTPGPSRRFPTRSASLRRSGRWVGPWRWRPLRATPTK